MVFRKSIDCHSGSYSYQTLLKDKRATITRLDDNTIEMADGTIAELDPDSDGRIYEVRDLQKADKQSNIQDDMQSVEPSLIDLEMDEDPNLAVVKVDDRTTQFRCIYCRHDHLSMMTETTSKRTFCNISCQESFYQ